MKYAIALMIVVCLAVDCFAACGRARRAAGKARSLVKFVLPPYRG